MTTNQVDGIPVNQKEKIKELMNELYSTAVKIRGSWAEFDGRDLLKDIDLWLMKLSDVTGVDYRSYYQQYFTDGGYSNQEKALKERWKIDISTHWGVDD